MKSETDDESDTEEMNSFNGSEVDAGEAEPVTDDEFDAEQAEDEHFMHVRLFLTEKNHRLIFVSGIRIIPISGRPYV